MTAEECIAALEAENEELHEVIEELTEAVEANTDGRDGLARQIAGLKRRFTEIEDHLDTHEDALRAHGNQIDQLSDAPGRSAGVAKVAKIREAIVRRATRKGKTTGAQAAQQKPIAMDYNEVLALFDYEIDRSYASKLLSKAACDESDDHGAFWIDKSTDRKKLKLDMTELPEESPYRPSSTEVTTDSRGDGVRESFNTSYSEGGG